MMSSGMRMQSTSNSDAASRSVVANPSAVARSRVSSARTQTVTSAPESRRFRAHGRPWLP